MDPPLLALGPARTTPADASSTPRGDPSLIFGMGTPSPSNAAATGPSPNLRSRDSLADAAARHIAALRLNTSLADVFLTITDVDGTQTRLPAHRCILAAGSPTFAAMFESGMQESVVGATVEVQYSRQTVECLLGYLYCDTDRCASLMDYSTSMELLDACTYFQLDTLKEAAVSVVRDCTTSHTVLDVLTAAIRFGSTRLREHCVGFMRQHNTDVLGSSRWVSLPLEVAVLLIRETVIESEHRLLQSCIEWCRVQAHREHPDADDATLREATATLLGPFLPYINFTAMTDEEVTEIEAQQYVPLAVLYQAFKAKALGQSPTWQPRNSGILLQWEMGPQTLRVANNHVSKVASDFTPRVISTMNRFSAGRHYWTMTIVELRTKHDCIVGVRAKPRPVLPSPSNSRSGPIFGSQDSSPTAAAGPDFEIMYEPCCNAITAIPSSSLRVTKPANAPDSMLGPDHSGVVGVLVDFDRATVSFYDHVAKALLYTVEAVPSDDLVDEVPTLPAPLFPSATLYHRSNGGVILGDTTTYLNERTKPVPTAALLSSAPAHDSSGAGSNLGTPKRGSAVPSRSRPL